ncbi:MAG: VWA domain-containing protein [Myxococcales bacterium]|nr:VWA domain-containing protein [Myxococcales bacterium]
MQCQDYPFEQRCAEAVRETRTQVELANPVPVDILFVIDNSGSMQDEQENLSNNFSSFISVLAASQLNYRIGVVTTDVGPSEEIRTNGPEIGGVQTETIDNDPPYFTVDSDSDPCSTIEGLQHGCFRDARERESERWLDSNFDSPSDITATFQATARVGTCGSGAERGTAAILAALRKTQGTECNTGFLRNEANLVIIMVSDEDNFVGSTDDPVDNPSTPSAILNAINTIKPVEQVRFALIGAVINGNISACRIDDVGNPTNLCGNLCEEAEPPPNTSRAQWRGVSGQGCDSCSSYRYATCCAADVGAARYRSFALALEQRIRPESTTNCAGGINSVCLLESICQSRFADSLQQIAQDLVAVDGVNLNPPAEYPPGVVAQYVTPGGSIRELVNGADFVISDDGATLSLRGPDSRPLQGESLEVYVSNLQQVQDDGICAAVNTTP